MAGILNIIPMVYQTICDMLVYTRFMMLTLRIVVKVCNMEFISHLKDSLPS